MVDQLFKLNSMKEWDLSISTDLIKVDATVLPTPQVIVDKQIVRFDPRDLTEVSEPKHLLQDEWIMVYAKSNRKFADTLLETL